METKVFREIEHYQTDKHVHVPVFNGERTKVLLLCLSPGLTVPPHSHPGFEITLQPLLGKALLPTRRETVRRRPTARRGPACALPPAFLRRSPGRLLDGPGAVT